ncbi:hypothetical protein OS493_031029 [Desmophyllum pertusum]|uniref:G-protein coupled receptors family 1 profile domain-containing protein n=1 Tax=Desmophyllum pertusum TaxID=174260 RepID=A0A9X0CVF9_9CNID|nr:hypothetical protein OS493_031029 [Desmophyllum pertusum]
MTPLSWIHRRRHTKSLCLSCTGVMFLFSLSGNSLTIYIVLTKPYMRSITNCLIANMAIADLFMTLSAMPYSAAYAYVGSRWFGGTMGMITCKILHFSVALSIAASILTLVVIALDRFFAVVYPFKRPSVIRKISVVSTVIWVLSILSTSPYLYYYKALPLQDVLCPSSSGFVEFLVILPLRTFGSQKPASGEPSR